MSFYDRLLAATAAERNAFKATPLIRRAIAEGLPREVYVAYLTQAYLHVSQTCPLLALAADHAGPDDSTLRDALFEYIEEEKGHELWILDDVVAMGGDREAARQARMNIGCRAMVGYVRYAIEHLSPYALLGMVHVLEGMSVELADAAAAGIGRATGAAGGKGFSYLVSHGSIDQEHVAFFRDLVNGIEDRGKQDVIIETARIVYWLFGEMFNQIGAGCEGSRDAA